MTWKCEECNRRWHQDDPDTHYMGILTHRDDCPFCRLADALKALSLAQVAMANAISATMWHDPHGDPMQDTATTTKLREAIAATAKVLRSPR